MSADRDLLDTETKFARETGMCFFHGLNFCDCRGCWLAQTGKPERPNKQWAADVLRGAGLKP